MFFCFGGKWWFSNFQHVVILSPSSALELFDFLWFLFHTWSVGTPPPHLEAMEGSASEGGRESRRGRGEGPVGRQPCHTSPQTSYYRGSLGGVKWGLRAGIGTSGGMWVENQFPWNWILLGNPVFESSHSRTLTSNLDLGVLSLQKGKSGTISYCWYWKPIQRSNQRKGAFHINLIFGGDDFHITPIFWSLKNPMGLVEW